MNLKNTNHLINILMRGTLLSIITLLLFWHDTLFNLCNIFVVFLLSYLYECIDIYDLRNRHRTTEMNEKDSITPYHIEQIQHPKNYEDYWENQTIKEIKEIEMAHEIKETSLAKSEFADDQEIYVALVSIRTKYNQIKKHDHLVSIEGKHTVTTLFQDNLPNMIYFYTLLNEKNRQKSRNEFIDSLCMVEKTMDYYIEEIETFHHRMFKKHAKLIKEKAIQ